MSSPAGSGAPAPSNATSSVPPSTGARTLYRALSTSRGTCQPAPCPADPEAPTSGPRLNGRRTGRGPLPRAPSAHHNTVLPHRSTGVAPTVPVPGFPVVGVVPVDLPSFQGAVLRRRGRRGWGRSEHTGGRLRWDCQRLQHGRREPEGSDRTRRRAPLIAPCAVGDHLRGGGEQLRLVARDDGGALGQPGADRRQGGSLPGRGQDERQARADESDRLGDHRLQGRPVLGTIPAAAPMSMDIPPPHAATMPEPVAVRPILVAALVAAVPVQTLSTASQCRGRPRWVRQWRRQTVEDLPEVRRRGQIGRPERPQQVGERLEQRRDPAPAAAAVRAGGSGEGPAAAAGPASPARPRRLEGSRTLLPPRPPPRRADHRRATATTPGGTATPDADAVGVIGPKRQRWRHRSR